MFKYVCMCLSVYVCMCVCMEEKENCPTDLFSEIFLIIIVVYKKDLMMIRDIFVYN